MVKKKTDPHKKGKFTGYELIDGKYYIAPTHKDSWERLREEERALGILVRMVTDHVANRLIAVTTGQTRWWAHLEEDFGVVFRNKGWQFNIPEGCIEPVPSQEPKP